MPESFLWLPHSNHGTCAPDPKDINKYKFLIKREGVSRPWSVWFGDWEHDLHGSQGLWEAGLSGDRRRLPPGTWLLLLISSVFSALLCVPHSGRLIEISI